MVAVLLKYRASLMLWKVLSKSAQLRALVRWFLGINNPSTVAWLAVSSIREAFHFHSL